MPETPESQAVRDQTATLDEKLEEIRECMVHSCEDWTDVATALDHIAETLDYIQSYYTGQMVHEYDLNPEKSHPGGTHPVKT
jgi:hypothetical protein